MWSAFHPPGPSEFPPQPSVRSRFHGPPIKFVYLTTTSNRGSDLHQSYQLQLCCVLRLSQPLDASFRPYPSSLISCWYRPGFSLQSFPLDDSLVCLSTPSAPPAFLGPPPKARPLDSRDSCTHQVRTFSTGVTRYQEAVPLLTFAPPRFPSLGLDLLSEISSHGLEYDPFDSPR